MDLFDRMLEESPVALEEYVTLPEIGGEIKVYEGEFFLKKKAHSFSITGRVYYSFAEKIRLLFKGVFERFDSGLVVQEVEIIAGEYLLGYAFVQKVSGNIISGYVNHLETASFAQCERWRWCYFNGLKFFGESVRRNRSISKDRLVFKAGPYIITIDNKEGYTDQKEKREISHFCQLMCSDGSYVSKQDAINEVLLFSRFISFVFGCQHAPFFIQGLSNNEVVYEYNAIGLDDSLIGVSSWKPDFKDSDLITLWRSFRLKYFESVDQCDILNTVVHWYLQANMNKGLLEGALLLGFTGIELLSNVIVGKELNNEQIIEDLISRLNLNIGLTPAEIASTRNYLMHYKNERRRKVYNSMSFEEKYKRMEVELQILELAILYWLGYEGHYADRLDHIWQGAGIQSVPWCKG